MAMKQLNTLIAEGIASAPDLKIAEARLRQADAAAQQSDANLWPTLTGKANVSETRASLNQGFPQQFQSFLPHGWHDGGTISGNLNYDLDLFGKNRAAFAAATSDADAARIDVEAARLTLTSAIASAYANLVQADGGSRRGGGCDQCPQAERRSAASALGATIGEYRHGVGGSIAHTMPRKPISTVLMARSRWPATSWRP